MSYKSQKENTLLRSRKSAYKIKERLKFIMDYYKIDSVSMLAEICEIPYVTLYNFISDKKEPAMSYKYFINIGIHFNEVSLDWLIYGIGEMILIRGGIVTDIVEGDQQMLNELQKQNEEISRMNRALVAAVEALTDRKKKEKPDPKSGSQPELF